MAANDIHRQLRSLRVNTARKKRDPFATGFEDEVDERRRNKSQTQAASQTANATAQQEKEQSISTTVKPVRASSIRDSEHEFLDAKPKKPSTDRGPSPAVPRLPLPDSAVHRSSIDKALSNGRTPRGARAQAGGILAYLDDSEDEEALAPPPARRDRRPSPAPRGGNSPDSELGRDRRSSTPRGEREGSIVKGGPPPKNTVASPFAGTKYLQDSDSDEEAVTSRNNSTDGTYKPEDDDDDDWGIDALGPLFKTSTTKKHLQVKRVDKPKPQDGGGVSWRAFSTSRTEQRSAEIEALQASLRKRGKSISFGDHAVTDDGDRIPLLPSPTSPKGLGNAAGLPKPNNRGRSPPRRASDLEPTADEIADSTNAPDRESLTDFKSGTFSGAQRQRGDSNASEGPPSNVFDLKQPGSPHGSIPDIKIGHVTAT
nr:hypothetical protein B0A51_17604 [Rachicladosporium sp. CCFEE 5018]OQO20924.1 hypothetical protein B0A51_13148 [Rachicladosporium sp. CCFEE 5018]